MDTFQKIQQLAEEVAEGKISMTEAILSLPEDFSECKGEVVSFLEPQENK